VVTAVTVATVSIAEMTAATIGVMTACIPLLAGVEAVDPQEGGEAVVVDDVAPLPGLMSPAKSAIRRAILLKTAGPATPRMMTMVTRRFMPPMVSTQIGTRIRVLLITSRVNSTT
jgi:hypothetical protein